MKRILFVLFPAMLLLFLHPDVMAYTTKTGAVGGQTWTAGTYYISGNLSVAAGTTLTLEPGVIIKVATGPVFNVDGTLLAQGTESQPIILSSMDDDTIGETITGSDGVPAPGDWRGVEINGFSAANGTALLEHCTFRYAGRVASGAPGANVYFNYADSSRIVSCRFEQSLRAGARTAACRPLFENCTFHGNLTHGLEGLTGGTPAIWNCNFTQNISYAASLAGINMGSCGGNGGSGNGVNVLGFSGDVADGHTLHPNQPGLPYGLIGATEVLSTQSFTLAAGVHLKATSVAQLNVNGTLTFAGNADSLVVITSIHDDTIDGDSNSNGDATSATPGDWRGIHAYGYSAAQGIVYMDHARICYGGNIAGTADANLRLNYCDDGWVRNSSFENSSQSGVRFDVCTVPLTECNFSANLTHGVHGNTGVSGPIHDCEFTGNVLSASTIDANAASYGGNSGSGNGVNGIVLSSVSYMEDASWTASEPGFAMVLSARSVVELGRTLTLHPGVVVKGQPGGWLEVEGTLNALGTADSLVVFTSLRDDAHGGDANGDGDAALPAPGDWYGILMDGYSANQGVGTLEHCWLGYGGNTASAYDCNLYVSYSDSMTISSCSSNHSMLDGLGSFACIPSISGCEFAGNTRHGIYISSTTSPRFHDCTFTGNGQAGAWFQNSQVTDMGGCGGSGNGLNGIKLMGCSTAENLTLGAGVDFAYVLSGMCFITAGDTMWTLPGVVFKSEPGSTFEVRGCLLGQGVESNPVLFTSLRDDAFAGDTNADGAATSPAPGDWVGLVITGYSGNLGQGVLEHVWVRYGGSSNGNIYCYSTPSPAFHHCRSEYAQLAGAFVSSSSPLFEDCVFTTNGTEGVRIFSGQPMLGDILDTVGGGNHISGNLGAFQFWNQSGTVVQACNNDWGAYEESAIDLIIRDDEEGNPTDRVIFSSFVRDEAPSVIGHITASTEEGVALYYSPVLGATGYEVTSCATADGLFELDSSGAFVRNHWEAPLPAGLMRFYQVRTVMLD